MSEKTVMKEMNKALSESDYNYIYQDNSDQELPIIIAVESSN